MLFKRLYIPASMARFEYFAFTLTEFSVNNLRVMFDFNYFIDVITILLFLPQSYKLKDTS